MQQTDDPNELARTAQGMAGLISGKNAILAPWWAVGAGVDALVQLAAGDSELAEPARLAVQIMASVYNEKMGRNK